MSSRATRLSRSIEIEAAESGGSMDSNFLGLMDLWVQIFWVGLKFLMVCGFKFFGFNGFVSVMDF